MSGAEREPQQRRYWRSSLRLTAALLVVWFVVTFVVAWFARELQFRLFGFPFSVWVAAQGAPLVYLLLIGLYARAMNRLDDRHGAADRD
jgi:putative solute:sodium symporter small subunit